jgi:hypothetical protein
MPKLTSGWDSQLIAREANSSAPLEVDTVVKPSQKEYLLLWRNSEKPKAPFNLTPYAITLVSFSTFKIFLCLQPRTTFHKVSDLTSARQIAGCGPINAHSRTRSMRRPSCM